MNYLKNKSGDSLKKIKAWAKFCFGQVTKVPPLTRHLGFLSREDPGESVPDGSEKNKMAVDAGNIFQFVQFAVHAEIRFLGLRNVEYSLRAPVTFDDNTSGKFLMALRVKGKLSFAKVIQAQS